jgi:hypothetical protein
MWIGSRSPARDDVYRIHCSILDCSMNLGLSPSSVVEGIQRLDTRLDSLIHRNRSGLELVHMYRCLI